MHANASRNSKPLLAVDTGGTFTDFYFLSEAGPRTHKVLSTPDDPARAILQGIAEMGLNAADMELIHGSTVATNAFLERKGAKVALVTTEGFEDILEIGRQNRPGLYDLQSHRTPPLVAARHRYGLDERIDAKGRVTTPLKPGKIRELIQRVKRSGCEAVAVVLLFSFRNAEHETKLRQALNNLGLKLSLSCEICPEYREFERTSTTCINAYVSPIMGRYLERLEKGLPGRVRVMQSNGGALAISEASAEAVRTLLSGPAGGALGALQVSRQTGVEKLLTLDMGGTSTDMALLDGALEYTTEANLGGLPLKTPMIRIDTIGAGGGSLAWRDPGGSLRVGPQSAGAEPGPLCYGRGGAQVTLTDAHVYLGRIPPHRFLGGAMDLRAEKISAPLKKLARSLGLKEAEVAQGILTVANANMARALRVLSLERGYDPREFTLFPFGGAGALHACALAEALGMRQVLVPRQPGILSAFGMAHADWVRDYVKTLLWPVTPGAFARLQGALKPLSRRARDDAKAQGFSPRELVWIPTVDLRFKGQSYELTVPLIKNFTAEFLKQHRAHYGFNHRRELEIVNLRLQVRVPLHAPKPTSRIPTSRTRPKPAETIPCYWEGKRRPVPVYEREALRPGQGFSGPAIVTEFSATTFVPPGWRLSCDSHLHLRLKKVKP